MNSFDVDYFERCYGTHERVFLANPRPPSFAPAILFAVRLDA